MKDRWDEGQVEYKAEEMQVGSPMEQEGIVRE